MYTKKIEIKYYFLTFDSYYKLNICHKNEYNLKFMFIQERYFSNKHKFQWGVLFILTQSNITHLWGMESTRLSRTNWRILIHCYRRKLFSCLIVYGRDKRLTFLLRLGRKCSVGFISGEYTGQTIRRIPLLIAKLFTEYDVTSSYHPWEGIHPNCSTVRDNNKSEHLISE